MDRETAQGKIFKKREAQRLYPSPREGEALSALLKTRRRAPLYFHTANYHATLLIIANSRRRLR